MYKILLTAISLGLLASCASQPEYIEAPTPVSQNQTADDLLSQWI